LVVAPFTSGCAPYRAIASLAAVEPRTGSTSQEQEIDLFATGQDTIVERSETDLLSAASPERLAKLVFSESAPDRIVGKRLVFKGPLVALFKNDEPLHTLNPFSVCMPAPCSTPTELFSCSAKMWDATALSTR